MTWPKAFASAAAAPCAETGMGVSRHREPVGNPTFLRDIQGLYNGF